MADSASIKHAQGSEPAAQDAGIPRWEQFADYARKSTDEHRRSELFLQAANLCEDTDGDPTQAAALYREALEANPHESVALLALERIYLHECDWTSLYLVYGLHAEALEAENRKTARAELLGKMARLARERLSEKELAAVCYENLLDATPGDPEAIRFLLTRHQESGDHESIERVLSVQITRVPDASERSEMQRILAETIAREEHRAQEAARYFGEACESDPLNHGAFQGLLGTLHGVSDPSAHVDLFARREKALAALPVNPNVENALFDVRLRLFDLLWAGGPMAQDRARKVLDAAASLRPHDPDLLLREAELHVCNGEFERGARTYGALSEKLPEGSEQHTQVLFSLAEILRGRLGRPEEARGHLRSLMASGGMIDEAHVRRAGRILAEIELDGGNQAAAYQLFCGLLAETDPEETSTVCEYELQLAALAEDLGRDEEALERYQRVLGLFPRFRKALRESARIYSQLGKWQQALKMEFEFFQALPEHQQGTREGNRARLRLARIYRELGDLERASEHFRELEGLDPDEFDDAVAVKHEIALLHQNRGQTNEAAQHWRELQRYYKEAGDDSGWASAAQQLGKIAELEGRKDEAGELYAAAIDRDPALPEARKALAAILESQSRWNDAREHYSWLLDHPAPGASDADKAELARALDRCDRHAFFEGDLE